ncbi:MAG TPA: hypothetical protein VKZ70_08530 [Burkholderiaceae bacterium]|nr:hypothetical protein [Burkholderiaceae bacterium]
MFADIDLAAVAEPFGIRTATVRRIEDLSEIEELINDHDCPVLIDCKVNGRVAAAFTSEHP